jgi:adenosine kinase
MHFSQTPTGTFSALTDQNDCQVGGFYPGAMGDAKTLSFVPFADTDTLAMISAHEPKQMNVQVHECVKNSIPYCYDPSHQITAFTKSEILYGVSHAEIVFVNDYELGLLEKATKLTTQALLQMIKVCVVTLGEKGSFVYEQREDNRLHIPAVKIEKLIDPTGAGDAFRAGFLYGYIRQWPLERCAQLGSVVAAYACEKHGTQEHTFSRGNVNKRFEQTYKTKLNLK